MVLKIPADRITGVFLVGFVAAIGVSLAVWPELNTYGAHFDETLATIANEQARWGVTGILYLLGGVLAVVSAGGLYQVFRGHDQLLAVWGALGFAAFGLLVTVAFIGVYVVRELAPEFVASSGPEAHALRTTAWAFAEIIRWVFYVGAFTFLVVAMLAFGALIIQSAVVPRWLGWLALVLSVVMALYWVVIFISFFWAVGWAGFLGTLLWFLITGGWLLVRGSRTPTET